MLKLTVINQNLRHSIRHCCERKADHKDHTYKLHGRVNSRDCRCSLRWQYSSACFTIKFTAKNSSLVHNCHKMYIKLFYSDHEFLSALCTEFVYPTFFERMQYSMSFAVLLVLVSGTTQHFRLWVIHDDVIKWNHFPRYWSFFTGNSPVTWWIPLTKDSDAELWCFLWSTSEQTVEQTIETPVIWDAIALIMTTL